MNARKIITLSSINNSEPIDFEDAFGEFSEARGDRKAKRKAKKNARKAKRTARKTNRVSKKTARKAKRTARKTNRVSKKTARKDNRQAKKTARKDKRKSRVQNRQEKRNIRQDNRIARKNQRAEEKAYRKELIEPEELDEQYLDDEYGYDDYGYDDDYEGDYDSYDDGNYDDYDDGYEDDFDDEYSNDDWGYEDNYDDNDGYDDDYYADEDYNDYDDDDWGYFDANVTGVDGSLEVNPRVQKITDKLEFNKELLGRLITKHKASPNKELKQKGKEITERIKWLENKLDAFIENSDNDEKHSFRKKHIGMALGKSRIKRNNIHKKKNNKTIVDSNVNSKISKNRIEIPSENTSNAIGGFFSKENRAERKENRAEKKVERKENRAEKKEERKANGGFFSKENRALRKEKRKAKRTARKLKLDKDKDGRITFKDFIPKLRKTKNSQTGLLDVTKQNPDGTTEIVPENRIKEVSDGKGGKHLVDTKDVGDKPIDVVGDDIVITLPEEEVEEMTFSDGTDGYARISDKEGMSRSLKIGLIVGGSILGLGLITYFIVRKK